MEVVDAPLEMGMGNTVNDLVIFVIFIFLTDFVFVCYSSDMSSFRQQLAAPPAHRSLAGPSRLSSHVPVIPASVPLPAPKPQ